MRNFTVLAGVMLASLAATTTSFAASLTMFDDAKCGGASVTLTESKDDMATLNLAFNASSFKIKDGNWALYTGTNKTKSRLPSDVKASLAPGECNDLNKPFDNSVKSIELVH